MARPGTADPKAYAERWSALKNIPPFLAMIWRASPGLTAIMVALRLIRALVPVAMLWIGKLIIDEVVRLTGLPDAPASLTGWWSGGLALPLIWLVTAELALALGSDIIGRLVSYTDSMLQEKLVIFLSLRLMDHAASLDLATFEDPAFQDRLDRARRQTTGRIPILSQVMQQLQDSVTVISFGIGLIAYNPWLVLLLLIAMIPAFLGEMYFNSQLYALNWRRASDRRERDYLRRIASSANSAKEIKILA